MMNDMAQREFAYEVLGQVSGQLVEETSVNAMMAAMLGVLGVWLHYAHRGGYPADLLRADVLTMLDKALGDGAEGTVQ